MADKRVIEQTASSEIYNDDWFLKDSVLNGTTKISAENLAKGLIDNVDASDIAYDNSESGLTATNVQDAIDETFENAGKVDDVKVDGTSVVTNKVAEIEIPVKDVQVKTDSTYDSVVDDNGNAKIDLSSVTAYGEVPNLPQAIATFKDGADAPIKSLKVAIEPQQDLHGYDAPWVGGAGKNKFDKDNANVFNGYIAVGKVTANSNHRCIYIPCKPNTTYTVQKIAVANGDQDRFAVGYCDVLPANNVDCYDIQSVTVSTIVVGALLTLTITTGANASYLILWVSTTTYYSQSIATIQIELGSTATDYAPYSNICPISGWDECNVTRCGKNHFDKITFTVKKFLTSDGRIESSDNWSISDYIGVKGGTAYILSGVTNAGTVAYHCFYDKDKNFISSVISTTQNFTTPSNAVYVRISMRTETPDAVQFEYGNTATAYEPYNPNSTTYTIDLDGTRYGGEVDVVNGEGTDTLGYVVFDGSSDEDWVVQGTAGFYIVVSDKKAGMGNYIANNYKATNSSGWDDRTPINSFSGHPTLSRLYFRYPYEGFSADLTAWRAWLASNNVQVVYELATPTTYDTQPTAIKSLLGQNNIWADTGDINECVYRRDMSSTIDDIIARLEALENA